MWRYRDVCKFSPGVSRWIDTERAPRKLLSGQAPQDFTDPRARDECEENTQPGRQEHRGPQETQNQIDIAEKKLRDSEALRDQ